MAPTPVSSFPRKLALDPHRGRESRGPGGALQRRFPAPRLLDSRFSRPCRNCPLSLWERVGVREPRGKQAGVNGNEWEREGYWGPSPGLRPPSPRGRGVGFGTGRTGLRPPSPDLGRVAFGHPLPEGEGLDLGRVDRPSATLSQRERGWIWDGSYHRPSATLSQRERGFDTAWKAGMTISGVIASLGRGFDTAWKAGIQGWRGQGSAAGSQ